MKPRIPAMELKKKEINFDDGAKMLDPMMVASCRYGGDVVA